MDGFALLVAHMLGDMAVDRLGGTVEGQPTHEGNFLQRIDDLVTLEGLLSGSGEPGAGSVACLRHACLAALGFLGGVSILTKTKS